MKYTILQNAGITTKNTEQNHYRAICRVMDLYAEEYHRNELLKLNKSDVISSVSENTNEVDISKFYDRRHTFKKIL